MWDDIKLPNTYPDGISKKENKNNNMEEIFNQEFSTVNDQRQLTHRSKAQRPPKQTNTEHRHLYTWTHQIYTAKCQRLGGGEIEYP
jgi:hypothetical protein